MKNGKTISSEQGSALVYILLAVGLAAAVTVTMMRGNSTQSSSMQGGNTERNLSTQIELISSAIQECILTHPDQDSELTTTEQKNGPYPINPKDPYYTAQSAVPAVATSDLVENIRCPGDPGGAGANNQNHKKIFTGSAGRSLPPPPAGFSKWSYYNGADGVYIMTYAVDPSADTMKAIGSFDKKYNSCQTDVTDLQDQAAARMSSDIVPGDTTQKICPTNAVCVRYWFIQKTSALEADAGCNGAVHAHLPPDDPGGGCGGLCLPPDM